MPRLGLLAAVSAVMALRFAAMASGGDYAVDPFLAREQHWGGQRVAAQVGWLPATNAVPAMTPPPAAAGGMTPFTTVYPNAATVDPAVRLASQSQPQYLSQPLTQDNVLIDESAQPPRGPPPGTRPGLFQKFYFTGTWLAQTEQDDLGQADLDASIVLGLPFPQRETPLLITPRFGTHYLDGPVTPDLPPRVYDASIEWRHMRKINEAWSMDVAVTTGYYSDFESGNGDAFRITGRGLGVYEWSPTTKVILGVVYLNRAGASVLPAAGLFINPNESTKLELLFPRPRVAWRLEPFSTPGVDERWLYVAGEFGGGVWAIQDPDGADDVVTINDYRLLLGIERKVPGGLGHRFEVGYVFGREVEFDSATPDYDPSDTVLLRYGIVY